MEKRKVIVRQRQNDYIAYFEDNPAKWEAGKDDIEAIGKLFIVSLDELKCYIYWYNKEGTLI